MTLVGAPVLGPRGNRRLRKADRARGPAPFDDGASRDPFRLIGHFSRSIGIGP